VEFRDYVFRTSLAGVFVRLELVKTLPQEVQERLHPYAFGRNEPE
jgi:hypothetical protein